MPSRQGAHGLESLHALDEKVGACMVLLVGEVPILDCMEQKVEAVGVEHALMVVEHSAVLAAHVPTVVAGIEDAALLSAHGGNLDQISHLLATFDLRLRPFTDYPLTKQ